MNNWIETSKELPKEKYAGFSDWVLAATRYGAQKVDRYDYEQNKWLMFGLHADVIIWQPLPEIPDKFRRGRHETN